MQRREPSNPVGGSADNNAGETHHFSAEDLAFLDRTRSSGFWDLPAAAVATLSAGEQTRKPWAEPADPLPVDIVVASLIDRKDALGRPVSPRISAESTGGACPYELVRYYLDSAGKWAGMAAVAPPRLQAERDEIKRRLADVSRAREALEALATWDVSAVDVGNFSRPVGLGNETELNARSIEFHNAHDRVAGALADLVVIARVLEARQMEIPRRLRSSHLAWRDAFIEHLGMGWHRLTGANPSYGGVFTAFVAASFESVGGGSGVEWDRAVRFVLNEVGKRPEEQRFDRVARALQEPRAGARGNEAPLPGRRWPSPRRKT